MRVWYRVGAGHSGGGGVVRWLGRTKTWNRREVGRSPKARGEKMNAKTLISAPPPSAHPPPRTSSYLCMKYLEKWIYNDFVNKKPTKAKRTFCRMAGPYNQGACTRRPWPRPNVCIKHTVRKVSPCHLPANHVRRMANKMHTRAVHKFIINGTLIRLIHELPVQSVAWKSSYAWWTMSGGMGYGYALQWSGVALTTPTAACLPLCQTDVRRVRTVASGELTRLCGGLSMRCNWKPHFPFSDNDSNAIYVHRS